MWAMMSRHGYSHIQLNKSKAEELFWILIWKYPSKF